MAPQELKNSILNKAFSGKLVPQYSFDEDSEQLYKKVQIARSNLSKENGRIINKKYPSIVSDELPQEIPSSWKYVRLQELVFSRGQKKPDRRFSYIDIGSIDNTKQTLNKSENIISPDKAPSRARKIIKKNDIIYSTVRPYLHNVCIIDKDFSVEPIASTGFACLACLDGLYNKYLFYFLLSPIFDNYANNTNNSKGVAYPAINDEKFFKAVVPLPPLAEQKRIVAKIEELMPLVDRYEKAYNRRKELNAAFPEELRKSLMLKALSGKMESRNLDEGSGDAVLSIIAKEREKIKLKNKKQKGKLEKDYEIPETWAWASLDEVAYLVGNKDNKILSKEIKPEGKYPVVSQGQSLIDGYCDFDSKVIDDLPLVMFGDHTRNVKLIDFPFVIGADGAKFLKPIVINERYLYYWVAFTAGQLRNRGYARHFSLLSKKAISIPPILEQKRIAEKIDELLLIVERMEEVFKHE